MREIKFKSEFSLLKTNKFLLDESLISDEPMIYGGSWEFCRENGGNITNNIMDEIQGDVFNEITRSALIGYHPVIDTKTILLMPGQTPCIPGWHCDGVIRKDRGSQPDLTTLNEPVYHYVSSVASEYISPTEILDGILVSKNIDENKVWNSVNDQVKNKYRTSLVESGQIVKFKRSTLHRGTPTDKRAWRFFFRLSFYHMPCMNEIRKQVQVYTSNEGW
jgi:hypothetical protein